MKVLSEVHHDVVQVHRVLQVAVVPAVHVAELDQALDLAFGIVAVVVDVDVPVAPWA